MSVDVRYFSFDVLFLEWADTMVPDRGRVWSCQRD